MMSKRSWAVLWMHWNMFEQKYHKSGYYRVSAQADETAKECGEDDNDGCIVSLPGKANGHNNDDIESTSVNDSDDESESESKGRKK